MTIPIRVGVGVDPLRPFDPDHWWAQIELMEELGYDSVWLPDSSVFGGPAPLPALAAAAARTERLKLGFSVLVLPARNPVLVARELATIDALSGGRLLPAVGLGAPGQFAALGLKTTDRVPRYEEALEIIRALWAGGPVTHRGRFWSFEGETLFPEPTRSRLELWLGATAQPALRRVGRLGDGWLASAMSPEDFAAGVELIRATAAEHERTIDVDHYGMTLFCAAREDDVPAALAARLRGADGTGPGVLVGASALREQIDRYVAGGASKFVVLPVARDPLAWLRELHVEVVAPVEAAAALE